MYSKIIRTLLKITIAGIVLLLLFVIYYQLYEIYHYRNISSIHILAINQTKVNFNVPLKKSSALNEDKIRIPVHAADGPYWIEFSEKQQDLRIHSCRNTAFGTYVVFSCFEIPDPNIRQELIRHSVGSSRPADEIFPL